MSGAWKSCSPELVLQILPPALLLARPWSVHPYGLMGKRPQCPIELAYEYSPYFFTQWWLQQFQGAE